MGYALLYGYGGALRLLLKPNSIPGFNYWFSRNLSKFVGTKIGSNLKQSFHFSIHSLMKASKSEARIRQNSVIQYS